MVPLGSRVTYGGLLATPCCLSDICSEQSGRLLCQECGANLFGYAAIENHPCPSRKRLTAEVVQICLGPARLVAGATSLLNLLFVALLVPTLIVDNQGGDIKTLYGLPPILAGSLVIPLLTTALAAILIVFAVLAWKRRYWSLGERIHYTLVAAAAVAFVWSLACLNLIGFHY